MTEETYSWPHLGKTPAMGAVRRDVTYQLDIRSQAAPCGLRDIETGNEVYLFLFGGAVVGRAGRNGTEAESGAVVFILSVDDDGKITQQQHRRVVTPGTLASPDLISLTAITAAGLMGADRASAKIGGTLEFAATLPDMQAGDAWHGADALSSCGRAYSPVDIIYELSVISAGAETGLFDTASGEPIYLFAEGAEVCARAGANADLARSGAVVFMISVDRIGNVLLDQQRDIATADGAAIGAPPASVRPDLVRLKARMYGSGSGEIAYANIAGALRFGGKGIRTGLSRNEKRRASDATVEGASPSLARQAEKMHSPHTML